MPLWLGPTSLVLASRSVARRMLLVAAGIPIEVVASDVDERMVEDGVPSVGSAAVARLLAGEKARAVASLRPGRLVVGGDQTLALGERRFTKPADRASAKDQLLSLAGRTHELYSAVCVVRDGATLFEHVGVARLKMRSLSPEFLETYLDLAGPAVISSVGAYQLERVGVQLFEQVEGDHFTILGLPLVPLLSFLRDHGWLLA
jgi:septum formation protein